MTIEDYNSFCRSLPGTAHVVQWGGAHVWKVGGKVFAIAWPDDRASSCGDHCLVTFKASDLSYEVLSEMPGCRPAPYLASRGLKWIQRTGMESVGDDALGDYIAESHRLVAAGLPKYVQRDLGLVTAATPQSCRTPSGDPEHRHTNRDLRGGKR